MRKKENAVRVVDNPNCKQFNNTFVWLSIMGDVYKVKNGVETIVPIKVSNGWCYFWIGKKRYSVGKAVYETFVGQVEKGYKVIHINGVKTNNAISNLKKVTDAEAFSHARKLKPLRGVANIKTKETFRNLDECAKHYGYTKDTLIKIINNKYKSNTELVLVYTD